uniref:Protein HGH1 C-terminal domain-containing protein n=1 Tax=Fundulus heteroclitus TaxID=8078 RepID=A0A3Q2UK60_FUNHE
MLLETLLLVRNHRRHPALRFSGRAAHSASLTQLTATKAGRQTLRHKSVYPIMREFHRWEKDVHVAAACEKLIQVLIGDEPEQGMENLMEVEIPQDVEEKLKEAAAKEQEELEKEERMRREEEEEEQKRDAGATDGEKEREVVE